MIKKRELEEAELQKYPSIKKTHKVCKVEWTDVKVIFYCEITRISLLV